MQSPANIIKRDRTLNTEHKVCTVDWKSYKSDEYPYKSTPFPLELNFKYASFWSGKYEIEDIFVLLGETLNFKYKFYNYFHHNPRLFLLDLLIHLCEILHSYYLLELLW